MSALVQAIEAAGGRAQLAKACGVRYQAIQKWEQLGRVPAERVLEVERITGVPREKLRPDIYPNDARRRAS